MWEVQVELEAWLKLLAYLRQMREGAPPQTKLEKNRGCVTVTTQQQLHSSCTIPFETKNADKIFTYIMRRVSVAPLLSTAPAHLGRRLLSSSGKHAAADLESKLVRISVHPAPVAFSERIAALKVLEQYGKVQMFKQIKVRYPENKPSLALLTIMLQGGYFNAIVDDETVADTLMRSSPILYALPAGFPTSQVINKALDAPTDSEPREVTMHITPDTVKAVTTKVNQHELAGPWPKEYKRHASLSQKILRQSVPDSMAKEALTCWAMDVNREPDSLSKRIESKKMLPSQMLPPAIGDAIFSNAEQRKTKKAQPAVAIKADDASSYYPGTGSSSR